MNIVFKRQSSYPQIEREFAQLRPDLLHIVETMAAMVWARWRDHLVITRIYEPSPDNSTHNKQTRPYRFIDVALLENGDSEMVRDIINKLFPYGIDGYETCPPLDHGTAPHFHLQVKP